MKKYVYLAMCINLFMKKYVYLAMCINLFMKRKIVYHIICINLFMKEKCLSDYVHQFGHEIVAEKKCLFDCAPICS